MAAIRLNDLRSGVFRVRGTQHVRVFNLLANTTYHVGYATALRKDFVVQNQGPGSIIVNNRPPRTTNDGYLLQQGSLFRDDTWIGDWYIYAQGDAVVTVAETYA